ncbi:unnamed protein product, partial [Mesorhabditis spiculigera]
MYSDSGRKIPFPIPVFTENFKGNTMLAPNWADCPLNSEAFKKACPTYTVYPKYLAQVETRPVGVREEARAFYRDIQAYQGGTFPHSDMTKAGLLAGELVYQMMDNFKQHRDCTEANKMLCQLKFYGHFTVRE